MDDSMAIACRSKAGIETPQLCIDLDLLEANLLTMASLISASQKQWRPHVKCHKSPAIAKLQQDAGAIGVTCAKVSEAEVFARDGIRDILIAHLPVGPRRVARICDLCETSDPIVTCDHYAQAQPLADECARRGIRCRVLVDIDIGMARTGVRPGVESIELAKGIDKLPGLELIGIMGYEGHAMIETDDELKRRAVNEALGILAHARDQFTQHGLRCDVVSAGGTGSLRYAIECAGITEVQAGGGIFGDPFYTRMPGVSGFRHALSVLSTIVSRPLLGRAVLDVGRKGISAELHSPIVKGFPDATVVMHSAEHIVLDLGPDSHHLRIGDQIELIVGYADFTTPLHDQFLCFRSDQLECVWPIAARGKLQ